MIDYDPTAERTFGVSVAEIEYELELYERETYELAQEIATGMRMPSNALDLAIEQAEFTSALDRFTQRRH